MAQLLNPTHVTRHVNGANRRSHTIPSIEAAKACDKIQRRDRTLRLVGMDRNGLSPIRTSAQNPRLTLC